MRNLVLGSLAGLWASVPWWPHPSYTVAFDAVETSDSSISVEVHDGAGNDIIFVGNVAIDIVKMCPFGHLKQISEREWQCDFR